MTIAHGNEWAAMLGAVAFGLLLVGQYCAAVDFRTLNVQIGRALADALDYAKVPVKVAAAICGMDESHFRKALRGEDGRDLPSLNKLARLPLAVWMFFGPCFLSIIVRTHAEELMEDVSDALARVVPSEGLRRRA